MKALLVFIIFILFSTMATVAQSNYQLAKSLDFFRSQKMQSGEWKNVLTENDIEGSPYLNDDFINGTIFTTTKMQFQNIPLRYNIYTDNLEFRTPEDKVMVIAAPEIVERAEFGEIKLSYLPYSTSKKIKRGFFKELVNNHVSLYSKSGISYKEPVKPAAYKDAEPARFIKKPDIFFLRIEQEAAILINNKKVLIELFPKHREAVEAYIKKNKVKYNKKDKLIELVNYYNSL